MKTLFFSFILILFALPCFCQDEDFHEEFIDLDVNSHTKFSVNTNIDNYNEEENKDEEQIRKEYELEILKEQNGKEISALQRMFEAEEDGIKRIELENRIKAKKIEYQAKKYMIDWMNVSDEVSIQKVTDEAAKVKKETAELLNNYESLLESNNEVFFETDKNLDFIQYAKDADEDAAAKSDNKTLNSMAEVLKPFVDKLKYFQTGLFKGDSGDNKIKILSLSKLNPTKKCIFIKITYTSREISIYNLKFDCSDMTKAELAAVDKSARNFKISPLFSVTQNNNNTLTKVLTGFKVRQTNLGNEKNIRIASDIREIHEIARYRKILQQYSDR